MDSSPHSLHFFFLIYCVHTELGIWIKFLLSIQRLSIKMLQCLLLAFSVPLSLALTLRSYQSSHPGGIPGGWGKEISLLIAQRGLGDRETSRTGGWGQRGPRNTGQVVMLPKALGWPRSLFGLFRTPQWTNPKGFFFLPIQQLLLQSWSTLF